MSSFQPNFPDPKFEYLTVNDGLPENSVSCIFQDRFGYLWLGTQTGLVKYDGYSMTVYESYINDSLSLINHYVEFIYEDRSGNLWVGTYTGLNRFNRKTETFTRHLNSEFILNMLEDFNGNLWAVSRNKGLYKYDRLNNNFNLQQFIDTSYYRTIDITAALWDSSSGLIHLGSQNGLYTLNANDELNLLISMNTQLGTIRSIMKSTDGILWIGHDMGLFSYDPVTKFIKVFADIQSPVRVINQDRYGFIWCYSGETDWATAGNKLIIIDPQSGSTRKWESNVIRSIYEDRSGIVWIGTGWEGLKKWDTNKWKFKILKHEAGNPKCLSSDTTISVAVDKEGIIWVGTNKGLDKLDRNKEVIKHYDFNNDEVHVVHINNKDNYIWLGTRNNGLIKFDPVKETPQYYSHNPNDSTTISSNHVFGILTDRYGDIWVGSRYDGLNRFNSKTGKFIRYKNNPITPGSISNNNIITIYEDRAGDIWIATDWGINRYDRGKDNFISQISPVTELLGDAITTMFEDSKGRFWVGNFTNGMHLFDREKFLSVKNYREGDGLSANTVSTIWEDSFGNLWIKTFKGMTKFNPETETFRNYHSPDGLPVDLTGPFFTYRGYTGEIFIVSYEGLAYFHPDSIIDDPTPPKVVISNLSHFTRADEELIYEGFISDLKEINLPYNHSDLRFDFVALHFGEPSKNKYKYKLEGFDNDWIDAGTQRNATYTNLSPGEYTFRVIACNRDGVWNEEGASLKLIIFPPFWATWWAYSLYIIFFGSILYGIRRYEMNRVNLKNQVKLDEVKLKEKEETDRMKSRFFANISHEFRTPLTLILGPIQKWKEKAEANLNEDTMNSPALQGGDAETHNSKQRHQSHPTNADELYKDLTMAERSTRNLLSLVNQLLDLSKLEAGKLKLQASKGNIVSFVKGVTMSFESLAERKGIKLEFISEKEEILLYFDRDKLAKILTNLLSNAFKFTDEAGSITVSIKSTSFPPLVKGELKGGSVSIIVRDTGIGISEEELPKLFDRFYQVDSSHTREHEGTGIGLALSKELVELHKGNIKVKSKVGTGSEFIVELLVGRVHLSDEEIVEVSDEQTEKIIIDKTAYATPVSEAIKENPVDGEDKTIILVVEDNADVRAYIKDSLGDNYHIEEAANGELGVERAKEIIPDLIISDIMMPKMDGNELTRRIKNDERTSHIPVILLTAKSEQESRLEGLETGADDYLTKPFDTKELQIRIKNLISIRKKLQEKYSKGGYVEKQDKKKLSPLDEKFMNKVNQVIESHLSEEDFSIDAFNNEIGMGKIQIYRKLKALTGNSPSRYLRFLRLTRAMQMIKDKQGSIAEIAYSVGFGSPTYFTKCFKEEFGILPSDLIK